jgi:LacI family transcriptional regulator
MNNSLIDGVIVSAMQMDDPLIDRLYESGRPFITVGRHPTNQHISYVDVDNRSGAYQAVSYLLRSGRKRVGAVNGPEHSIASWDRYQGYQDALRERGVPLNPDLLVAGEFSDASGYHAMKCLLQNRPDAVFVASDAMALACMRAIYEVGLRIPDDIAIIGFDDIPAAAHSKPPLTTVRQPIQRTGSLAAEMLIDMIEHPDSRPRRVVLPTELVLRSSC